MGIKRKALVEFINHSRIYEFEKTKMFCPLCGKQNVWSGYGDDFYLGKDYYCIECNTLSYLDHTDKDDKSCAAIAEQLRLNMLNSPVE